GSAGALATADGTGTASLAAGTTDGTAVAAAALAGTSLALVCRGRRESSIATRVPDSARSTITVNAAVSTLRLSPGGCAGRLRTCGSSLRSAGRSGGHRIESPAPPGNVATCGGAAY